MRKNWSARRQSNSSASMNCFWAFESTTRAKLARLREIQASPDNTFSIADHADHANPTLPTRAVSHFHPLAKHSHATKPLLRCQSAQPRACLTPDASRNCQWVVRPRIFGRSKKYVHHIIRDLLVKTNSFAFPQCSSSVVLLVLCQDIPSKQKG